MARGFNGSSDFISIASSSGVNPTSSAFTISVWFNPTVIPAASTYNPIYEQEAAGNTGGNYFIGLSGSTMGRLGWYFKNSASFSDPGVTTLAAGTWCHLLSIYDTALGLKTFVNGISDGTNSNAGTITWGTNVTTLGKSHSGTFINGMLADFAIWNTTLSGGNITSLVNGVRPPNVNSANLQAWLPLDGYASPEPDLSGNGNSGTLTGTSRVLGPPALWRIAA